MTKKLTPTPPESVHDEKWVLEPVHDEKWALEYLRQHTLVTNNESRYWNPSTMRSGRLWTVREREGVSKRYTTGITLLDAILAWIAKYDQPKLPNILTILEQYRRHLDSDEEKYRAELQILEAVIDREKEATNE